MGIIVDLIIIAIILLFIFMGYKKGLTGSLIKLLSFVISIVLAFVLYRPISNIIIEKTQIDDNIRTTIVNVFEQEDSSEEKDEKMPSTMIDEINTNIENATEQAKSAIIEETSKTIINITSGLIVFIIARIILFVISIFVKQITKLPIIKQVDDIGGIAYGAVEGIVIVYILLSIISLTSLMWINNPVATAVTKSTLGNMLYNNNIILNLFF